MIYCTFERSILILWTIIALATLGVTTVVSSPPDKADQVCDASTKDGSDSGCQHSLCHPDMNRCVVPSSIYESSSRSGKTAMAYVPNVGVTQPTTSTSGVSNDIVAVCDATTTATSPYRVATWPFSRSTVRKAPTITIKINFWTCQSQSQPSSSDIKVESKSTSFWSYFVSSKKTKQSTTSSGSTIGDSQCCCQPYHHIHKEDVMDIEMWQTRPDGTYPSIRSAWKDGNQECRARYKLSPPTTHHHHHQSENTTATKTTATTTTTTSLVVHTLAPGSTGIWNGLGPHRWDIPPYGPPVLHMMIHTSPNANTTTTTFIDIPIVISPTTLDAATFYGSDYRGPAWVRPAPQRRRRPPSPSLYHQWTKWTAQQQQHHIDMEMDVFLPRNPTNTAVSSLQQVLCPSSSYWYGFPTWFLVEPVAVCAPWLLDFFPL